MRKYLRTTNYEISIQNKHYFNQPTNIENRIFGAVFGAIFVVGMGSECFGFKQNRYQLCDAFSMNIYWIRYRNV